MIAGLAAVGILFVALFVVRGEEASRKTGVAITSEAWRSDSGNLQTRRWAVVAGAIVLAAALVPALVMGPFPDADIFGDDVTHARVGAEIARTGLTRGWIDSYLGGFPYAIHYPPLGTLLVAALVLVGLTPVAATHTLGAIAIALTPLALTLALLRARARPAHALLAGLVLAWIAPYNPFVGGFDAFFSLGLVSQVIALPLCIALCASVVSGTTASVAVVVGALAMLAHPQISVATVATLVPALAIAGRNPALERALRASIAMGAVGAGVYGPGLLELGVPFGWPPEMGWRHLGFPLARLEPLLLEGWLLDAERLPVITFVVGLATFALALQLTTGVARAALWAAVSALVVSVSGHALAEAGDVGRALLTFLQPLRFVALTPVLAALLVGVALEESVPRLEHAARVLRPAIARAMAPVVALAVALLLVPAALERLAYVQSVHADLASRAHRPCGAMTPNGYDGPALHHALGALDHGRAWYDADTSFVGQCIDVDDGQFATDLPLGTTAAVGAHVGIAWAASRRLDPALSGSLLRAEALGIRYVVAEREAAWPGWTVRAEAGPVRVLERPSGTDLVGVGCVTTRWQGSDGALRARLFEALGTPEGAAPLLDPHRFVEIARGAGPLVETATRSDCDASSARVITERAPEPGLVSSTIESSHPVDVVVRVTAYSGWRVTVDGADREARQVAPGFLVVTVPPGEHHVTAFVGWRASQALSLLFAALVCVACARLGHRKTTADAISKPAAEPAPEPAPATPTDESTSPKP